VGFSADIRERADEIWQAIFTHPFVVGIGEGTLPRDKLRFFIHQDYLYLVEYCRVRALAVAKAPDLATMRRLAEFLMANLEGEMNLHRRIARPLGIARAALARGRMAPTNWAYTRHLLHVAHAYTAADVVAATLPCLWTYSDIGLRLARWRRPRRSPVFTEWIRTYASPAMAARNRWSRAYLDEYARSAPPLVRARLEEHFVVSSRYELGFWEMAWSGEKWEA
jgi:thiaminase/transcriptional activator TenA